MLTLGIPGSPTAAVLLGGLLVWGLQPGPLLFVEQKDFVWGLIASMYLGNIAGLIVVLLTVPWFAAILRIPFAIIAPVILVICAVGAYTVHSSMFDVWLMLVFGVMGYVFKKLTIRWRHWCWRWCSATWLRTPSASRCWFGWQPHGVRFQPAGRQHHRSGHGDAVLPFIGQLLGKLRRRPKDIDDDDVVEV
jgi:hypothetical protein